MPARTLKSPVTYSVLIIAACAVLMSCAKEVPSQAPAEKEEPSQSYAGLGASRVKTDQCRISDAVERYFAAGEVDNIPRRKPTTLREWFLGKLAYNGDEVGFYDYLYKNAYIHLLHYVVSQDDFRYQPNCSTRMEIEITSWVPSSRRPRVNATEVYDFRANSNNQLCLHNDEYIENKGIEHVLVRACVHVENLQDDFDVDIKFAPDRKK